MLRLTNRLHIAFEGCKFSGKSTAAHNAYIDTPGFDRAIIVSEPMDRLIASDVDQSALPEYSPLTIRRFEEDRAEMYIRKIKPFLEGASSSSSRLVIQDRTFLSTISNNGPMALASFARFANRMIKTKHNLWPDVVFYLDIDEVILETRRQLRGSREGHDWGLIKSRYEKAIWAARLAGMNIRYINPFMGIGEVNEIVQGEIRRLTWSAVG